MTSTLRLLMFLGITGLSLPLRAQEEQQTLLGKTAPSFELKDTNGKTYSLESFRGSYVLIHFATTWCPFCNAEAPNLDTLYQLYKQKGVQVLIIDVKENKDLVTQSFKRFNFLFPVLLDEEGRTAKEYAPPGVLPDLARDEVVLASNLIVDKNGKIRFYSLLNTTSFDAKLIKARQKLDELLSKE